MARLLLTFFSVLLLPACNNNKEAKEKDSQVVGCYPTVTTDKD